LEAEGLIQSGLTLKGLRHTVATTLREVGLDERRIADLLGQKTLSMARHYRALQTLRPRTARPWRLSKPKTRGGRGLSNLPPKASNPNRKRDRNENKS
jgi:integrase